MVNDKISTGLGRFSREKFNALLIVRDTALQAIREALLNKGYKEVTTSSLVNIAGSCENPHASFSLNFYGREAHLSQSAQLQLEALVIRLKQPVFTVNNSFREENFDDPEEEALNHIIENEEEIIKLAIEKVLNKCSNEIKLLGGDVNFLNKVIASKFNRITHDEAIKLLNKKGFNLKHEDDLGIKEEREILKHFGNIPIFVTHHTA